MVQSSDVVDIRIPNEDVLGTDLDQQDSELDSFWRKPRMTSRIEIGGTESHFP